MIVRQPDSPESVPGAALSLAAEWRPEGQIVKVESTESPYTGTRRQ